MKRKSRQSSYNKSILIGLVIFLIFASISVLPGVINKVVNKTTKINDYKIIGEELLGTNKPTKILLLFENNAEARPGGGFIGTVGYVTVDKGKIKSEPVRSVYYYDYAVSEVLKKEKADGINDPDAEWNIRDSGQRLDWPTNAKLAKRMFEKQPNKEVDMVIGITPEVLKYFIEQTGSIKLNDYGVEVTKDNILESIQIHVEAGQDKLEGRDPKSILSSVANQIIERMSKMSVIELTKLAEGLQDLAHRKQITLYSDNYDVEQVLKAQNFDGSLVSFDGDYFMLSENNISIDKSNAFIDRKLDRRLVITDDGRVVVNAVITRNQTLPVSYEYIDPKAPDIVTNLVRKNISQIDFALPKGSKILSTSENIEVKQKSGEAGYDVYGFTSSLEPLTPSEYTISYELPFRLSGEAGVALKSYVQLQNGGWPYKLSMSVTAPDGWEFSAANKQNLNVSGNMVMYNGDIDRDFYLSLIYAKN